MRQLVILSAAALSLAACASILGFDDVSLGGPSVTADAAASTGDGDSAPRDPTCDGSVACGPCADNRCPPTPVLGDHFNVTALAVDSSWLYITSFNDVLRVDKTTNETTSLVPRENGGAGGGVAALALDGPNVYWASRFSQAFRCPSAGCPGAGDPIPVSPVGAEPSAIAVAGGSVLWIDVERALLYAADKLDGAGVRQVSSDNVRSDLIVADPSTAWIPDTLGRRIVRIELDGGASTTIAQTGGMPLGIAKVSSTIYFGKVSGNLGAVSAAGNAPTVEFGAPTKAATAITADATFLYWADQGSVDDRGNRNEDGCIWRCALATCTTTRPTALACGLYGPNAIAVDDHWLYWAALGPGNADELNQSTVTKIPLPKP